MERGQRTAGRGIRGCTAAKSRVRVFKKMEAVLTTAGPSIPEQEERQTLAEFRLPSLPGNERRAMERVEVILQSLRLPEAQLNRVKTAVAEASMNAMEHGNRFQPDLYVNIKVQVAPRFLAIQVSDESDEANLPEYIVPDLDAKLAGLQSPRGWGLFLIKSMVDELRVLEGTPYRTVELIWRLGEKTS